MARPAFPLCADTVYETGGKTGKNMLDFAIGVHYNRQDTWRCRVVGRARTIGNRVRVKSSSRVRISPSPPRKTDLPPSVGDLFFICGWRDSNRARAKREKHAGGMFRCPRACRRGARAGRISPSPPEKHGNSDRIAVLCFLCYDDRAGKAEGLSALLDDDW